MDMISLRRNLIACTASNLTECTVTGNPAAFTTKLAKPLKSITVPLTYTQSGTGDPYPPGGGKNKFDKNGTITSGEYLNSDGTTTSNESWGITDYIPIKGNAVTLSGVGGNNPSVCAYDAEKNYLTGAKYNTGSWDITTNITLTSETEIAYVRLSVYTAVPEYVNTIQLEVGSSATSYSQYSNIRPISGVSGLFCVHAKKNMATIRGYSAENKNYDVAGTLSNNYGTTISTTSPESSLDITQSSSTTDYGKNNYRNGYMIFRTDNMVVGQRYDVSFKVTNITSNPLETALSELGLTSPNGGIEQPTEVIGNVVIWKNMPYKDSSGRQAWEVRNCGMSCTVSEFMITPANTNDGVYEAYDGAKLDVTFPALGKNLLKGVESGAYTTSGIKSTNAKRLRCVEAIEVQAGQIYTISAINNAVGQSIKVNGNYYSEAETERTGYFSWSDLPCTITIPTGAKLLTVTYKFNSEDDISATDISNAQIELGDTASAYEPYNNSVYGGSLDLVSGVLTLTHKMQTITGEEQVTYTALNNSIYCGSDVFFSDSKSGTIIYGVSSIVPQGSNGSVNTGRLKKSHDSKGIQFYNPLEFWGLSEMSQSALEAKLQEWNTSGTPLQVVYELETPITIQLDPNATTAIKGTNTFWTDTTGGLTIKYLNKA